MKMHTMKVLSGMMLVSGAAAMAGEIGYIDMNKAANDYYVAIEKTEAFKEKRTKIVDDINIRARELQAVKAKFAGLQQAASEATDVAKRQTFVEAARELQLKGLKLEAELKEFYAKQEALIKKDFVELNTKVLEDVDAKLAEFAKGKNLDAVADVSNRAYPYYDKSKDITVPFLAKINAGKEAYVKDMIEKRKKDAEKPAEVTSSALRAADELLKAAEEKKTAAPVAPVAPVVAPK
jgi:Skp family chaperone for outer membrane proteins